MFRKADLVSVVEHKPGLRSFVMEPSTPPPPPPTHTSADALFFIFDPPLPPLPPTLSPAPFFAPLFTPPPLLFSNVR